MSKISLRLFRPIFSAVSIRPAARSFSVDATIEVSSPKSQSETALGSKNIPDKIVFDGEISDLPIHSNLKTILNKEGFHNLTHVQKMTIPKLLEGQGIHLITQTGTGKTLSYIISLLNMAHDFKAENETETKDTSCLKPKFVILTASRGNGILIFETINSFKQFHNMTVKHEFGSAFSISPKDDCEVIITSPVRLLEKVESETLSLENLKTIVIDDAGCNFSESIVKAVKKLGLKSEYQVVLVSSGTISSALINALPKPDLKICLEDAHKPPSTVSQYFKHTDGEPLSPLRLETLIEILKKFDGRRGVIFCNSLYVLISLESELHHRGFNTIPFHSKLDRNLSQQALFDFNSNNYDILVSSGMGACVNFQDVDFVINYEFPYGTNLYQYQVGRCGRIGKPGISVTFISKSSQKELKQHKQLLENKRKVLVYPNIITNVSRAKKMLSSEEN